MWSSKMEIKHDLLMIFVTFLTCFPEISKGVIHRCYSCRSRGELGSCKDSFSADEYVKVEPCASGWCGKMLETDNVLREEYGSATERRCLQRGPSDNEERCAYTKLKNQNVFMCFCRSDLCNSSSNILPSFLVLMCVTAAIFRLLL